MIETGLHITFPGGREAWIEFDGESRFFNAPGPIISEDVVFFSKGKQNRLRFNAVVEPTGKIISWSLDADGH